MRDTSQRGAPVVEWRHDNDDSVQTPASPCPGGHRPKAAVSVPGGTTQTLDKPADHDEGLLHACCCNDDDVALCGLDISTATWGTSADHPVCVVCDDLAVAGLCPFGGRCPHL